MTSVSWEQRCWLVRHPHECSRRMFPMIEPVIDACPPGPVPDARVRGPAEAGARVLPELLRRDSHEERERDDRDRGEPEQGEGIEAEGPRGHADGHEPEGGPQEPRDAGARFRPGAGG